MPRVNELNKLVNHERALIRDLARDLDTTRTQVDALVASTPHGVASVAVSPARYAYTRVPQTSTARLLTTAGT